MTGWNLPPGVTDRMIDEAAGGYDDDNTRPTPEEEEGEAWEYWNGRAMAAETSLHLIAELEPGTQQWIDNGPLPADEANKLLGEVFRIARVALGRPLSAGNREGQT